MPTDILIVDDEADIRELVAGILQDEGYGTRTAADADEALGAVVARRPNLVFLDIWLQGSRLDGLQLLDTLKQDHPELPVVMISGHGNIETAVSAIKRGAYDFIEKPFKADRLLLVAERALENSRLKREVRELKQLGPLASTLVGRSPAMNQLRQIVEKVGPTNSRVLIVGPSGAGKELAARTIHSLSGRASGPFVVINAAAIMPENMEVELFGVEVGNGTQSRKVGALEEAHGGTLFIDEIADMPRETQNKILRVLVDQTFQRVGGSTKVTVDVRIVSSTSRNIEADIAAGKFREDLYHRLSVVPIRVPALSERREDVPELVEYFMSQISQTTGLPKRTIGADALERLLDEHVQNLVLRLPWHLGDLVDEQTAPVRFLQRPDLAVLRAVAGLDAEQLDLHVLGSDGSRVDHHERSVGAGGERVNGAGGKLLAAARGPNDEDAAVGRPNLLDRLPQLISGGRAADHARRDRGELFELTHLAL